MADWGAFFEKWPNSFANATSTLVTICVDRAGKATACAASEISTQVFIEKQVAMRNCFWLRILAGNCCFRSYKQYPEKGEVVG